MSEDEYTSGSYSALTKYFTPEDEATLRAYFNRLVKERREYVESGTWHAAGVEAGRAAARATSIQGPPR